MALSKTDRDALGLVRDALAAVDAPGFTLSIGTMRYDPAAGTFTVTITGTREGSIGKEGAAYNELRAVYTMLPELGATVASARHGVMRVIGARARGRCKIVLTAGVARYTIALGAFIKAHCRDALDAMPANERARFLSTLEAWH